MPVQSVSLRRSIIQTLSHRSIDAFHPTYPLCFLLKWGKNVSALLCQLEPRHTELCPLVPFLL